MTQVTLAELQQSLQQYLLQQHNNINELTLETDKFSRQQRLAIYQNAYQLRLIEALQNDYPALHLMLGDQVFEKLILGYIEQHPSQHPSLRWVGEKLPHFLRNHPEWQEHRQLWELAEFEWAQITVFDAQDSKAASVDDLRSLSPELWPQLKLQFQPALQIVSYFSNAPELWYSLTHEQTAIATNVMAEAQAWLIWRDELQVVYRPLDKAEAWCLQAFLNGENFTAVCEGLSEWFAQDEVPMKAVQYLQQWLHNHLIAAID